MTLDEMKAAFNRYIEERWNNGDLDLAVWTRTASDTCNAEGERTDGWDDMDTPGALPMVGVIAAPDGPSPDGPGSGGPPE